MVVSARIKMSNFSTTFVKMFALNLFVLIARITEDGELRLTEDGVTRVLEDGS